MSLPRTRRVCLRAAGLTCVAAILTACAAPTRSISGGSKPSWTGRFALTIHSEPVESWSAGFELQGSASEGELQIHSPLGQRLANLHWSARGAELQQGDRVTQRPTLDALSAELAGGAVPVAALFDWLQGRQAPASGWEADLSRQAEGRIIARRLQPLPTAELRLVFEP
ncbi:lipoprotein insertase outer membrane protein LolB [Hydrogenophaga sp. RWCD_12]|uniref:lipoprotein insertase outer membrane protein LolB n=1 Tax=Hydrogenophaga sp. RWCD_12 TaxID=3391190 RepID=UPI003984CEF0